ncbi:TetR/AcrR family transcriptional regulator [Okeania sp. SIO2B9]|uniref:TetR/AcrR family transcriptional regulator n=1 Tax=Okeania sp. SIO2B9 TaxID=2607782 RepID=UPI00142A351B|nr:TetR-like C-terminal domain-containing protein [Okeania sp. SIO2B9]NES89389.1 TetR/AcrR family transcriptional regulator [Okeania sp. SIO2B9]
MAKPQLSTQLVVATAANIADAEGFDSVTLTRVARDLGTSQPALYRHVTGYDDLVRSLGLLGRELLGRRLADAAIGLAGEDAVRAMGLAWRQMVRDHPGLYAATDRYPCAGDAELEAAVERVVATLGQALVGFGLDADARVHAARTLRSAFHGFSHLESGDGHPLEQDTDESFERMIGLLNAGIRSMTAAVADRG